MFYAIAQKARTPTLYGPGISSHRLFQASVGSDGECDPARGPCYPERRLLKHPAYRLRSPGAWRTPSAVRSVLFSRRVLTSEPPRPRFQRRGRPVLGGKDRPRADPAREDGEGVTGRRALPKVSASAKQIYVRQGAGASEAIQISAKRCNAAVSREGLRLVPANAPRCIGGVCDGGRLFLVTIFMFFPLLIQTDERGRTTVKS